MSNLDLQAMLSDIREKTEISSRVEIDSLRTQIKNFVKSGLDMQAQISKLEQEVASYKSEVSVLSAKLDSVLSFSSRLTETEGKLAKLEAALEQK